MSTLEDYDGEIEQLKAKLADLEAKRAEVTHMDVKMYLHSSHDEYYDWELDDNDKQRFDDKVHDAIHYALYEVEFDVRFDLTTGKYVILQARDGEQILVPKEQ